MKCYLFLGLAVLVALSQAASFEDDGEQEVEKKIAEKIREAVANAALNDLEADEDDEVPEADKARQTRHIWCKGLGEGCGGLTRCCGSTICNPATKTCMPCIPKGSRCTTIKRKCCSGRCNKRWYHWNGICA